MHLEISVFYSHHYYTYNLIFYGYKGTTFLLLQGHVANLFYFITFEINFAVILVQFIFSLLSDKRSVYQYIEEDDVRDYRCECHIW